MAKTNVKVLLFNKEKYDKKELDKMTPTQLNEMALEDSEWVAMYDNLDAFKLDFNDGVIDDSCHSLLVYFVEG